MNHVSEDRNERLFLAQWTVCLRREREEGIRSAGKGGGTKISHKARIDQKQLDREKRSMQLESEVRSRQLESEVRSKIYWKGRRDQDLLGMEEGSRPNGKFSGLKIREKRSRSRRRLNFLKLAAWCSGLEGNGGLCRERLQGKGGGELK